MRRSEDGGVEARAPVHPEGRVLVVLASLFLATACSGPSRPCTSDDQCGGDRCDVELGACVSGAGGGSTSCDPACDAFAECDGTTCKNRYLSITIFAPSANEGSTAITALVELDLATGRTRSDPATLDYVLKTSTGTQVSSGTLTPVTGSLGRYSGPLGVLPTGQYTFDVSGAGLTATRAFVVDTTAPTLTVDVPARTPDPATATTTFADPDTTYANAWRRDQTVTVTVRANEDLARATVILYGTVDGGAFFTADASATTPCDAGFCGSAALDLWQVPMNAFRATLPLRITGVDKSGNQSAVDSSVKVTRWKWAFDAGTVAVTSPAIGTTGNVYFSSGGEIIAAGHFGNELWRRSVGGVAGSPAVGSGDSPDEIVYVGGTTGGNASVFAIVAADGGSTLSCPATAGSGKAELAIAIGRGDIGYGNRETAATAFSTNGRLVYTQADGGTAEGCAGATASVPAAQPNSNVIFSGGAIFFASDNTSVTSYTPGTNTPVAGFPASMSFNATALAGTGNTVVGSGFTTLSSGSLFVMPDGGQSLEVTLSDAGRTDGFILDSAGRAALTSRKTSELLLTDPLLTTIVQTAADAGSASTPVLGANGFLYALGNVRSELTAWRLANLTPAWTTTSVTVSDFPPGIDCPRDSSGSILSGRPGVLYAPGSDGKLRAIIVDSRGLDTTAKWPKWQRDPRNSGNADVDLSQFACGP